MRRQIIRLRNTNFYTPLQKRILHDNQKRFIFWLAGRRSGKSWGAMRWILTKALSQERIDLPAYWVSPIIETARKVFDKFCKEYKAIIVEKNLSRRQVTLPNNRYVFFVGAEKSESIEGDGAIAIVLDECRWVKDSLVWEETLRPMLSDCQGHALLISTPNANSLHWYNAYCNEIMNPLNSDIEKKWEEAAAYRTKTIDAGTISEQEIENARLTLPPDIFARNYLAEDTDIKGLIYKEFGTHNLVDEIPPWFSIFDINVGLDWGSTDTHPTVFTVCARDRSYNNHIILEEVYLYEPTISQVVKTARDLRARHRVQTFYTDTNRPDYNKQLLKEGLRAVLARKGKDSVENGIEIVRELLYLRKDGSPRLYFISRKTKKLQAEINQYRWKEGGEKPVKINDDGMDSMRYVLVMTGKGSQARIKYY